MKAVWNGVLLAESDDTIVIEGNHYFPADSLRMQYFIPSDHTTRCAWKGAARYYSISVDGRQNGNAAWFYPEPFAAAAEIKGRVAFWKGVEIRA